MDIQSANKQHPVPQNVMDVEFKLIGDLTVRQFSYILIFGFFVFVSAKMNLPAIFKYPLIGINTILGLGLAFFPINDISLDKWLVNYYKAITKPRVRSWQKTKSIPYYFKLTPKHRKDKRTTKKQFKAGEGKNIEDFLQKSKKQDLQKTDFNDETDLEKKEKEFYKKLGLKEQVKKQKGKDPEPYLNKKEIEKDEAESKGGYSSLAVNKEEIPRTQLDKTKDTKEEKKEEKIQVQKDKGQPDEKQDVDFKPTDYEGQLEEINKLKEKAEKEFEKDKLKKLDTERRKQKDSEKKEPRVVKEKGDVFSGFLEKISDLAKPKEKSSTKTYKKTEKKKQRKEKPIRDDIKQEEKQKDTKITKDFPKVKKQEYIKKQPQKQDTTFLDSKVNIIHGKTTDQEGKIVPSVVVIIKNEKGESVRALKSNQLGEFEISTPIEDGKYMIEAIKEGYKFNSVQVNALGSKLDALELVGKKD